MDMILVFVIVVFITAAFAASGSDKRLTYIWIAGAICSAVAIIVMHAFPYTVTVKTWRADNFKRIKFENVMQITKTKYSKNWCIFIKNPTYKIEEINR